MVAETKFVESKKIYNTNNIAAISNPNQLKDKHTPLLPVPSLIPFSAGSSVLSDTKIWILSNGQERYKIFSCIVDNCSKKYSYLSQWIKCPCCDFIYKFTKEQPRELCHVIKTEPDNHINVEYISHVLKYVQRLSEKGNIHNFNLADKDDNFDNNNVNESNPIRIIQSNENITLPSKNFKNNASDLLSPLKNSKFELFSFADDNSTDISASKPAIKLVTSIHDSDTSNDTTIVSESSHCSEIKDEDPFLKSYSLCNVHNEINYNRENTEYNSNALRNTLGDANNNIQTESYQNIGINYTQTNCLHIANLSKNLLFDSKTLNDIFHEDENVITGLKKVATNKENIEADHNYWFIVNTENKNSNVISILQQNVPINESFLQTTKSSDVNQGNIFTELFDESVSLGKSTINAEINNKKINYVTEKNTSTPVLSKVRNERRNDFSKMESKCSEERRKKSTVKENVENSRKYENCNANIETSNVIRKRKPFKRTVITNIQYEYLLSWFLRKPYPSPYRVRLISRHSGLPETVVSTWFQNRRRRTRDKLIHPTALK